MEVQGSSWSARKRTVIARMETDRNKNNCLKLDIEELELLMGPQDSEVDLRYLLMNASKRSSRICEWAFGSKQSVRWDECQRQRVTQAQEEGSQRSVQDENDIGDVCWTEACEGIARRMVKLLEDREAAKDSMRELEDQVLFSE